MKWQIKFNEALRIGSERKGMLFECVTLLVEVWEDPEFRAFHKTQVKALEYMDGAMAKVGDFGIEFMDAREMLKRFPNREQWESTKIKSLLEQTLKMREDDRRKTLNPKPVNKPTTPPASPGVAIPAKIANDPALAKIVEKRFNQAFTRGKEAGRKEAESELAEKPASSTPKERARNARHEATLCLSAFNKLFRDAKPPRINKTNKEFEDAALEAIDNLVSLFPDAAIAAVEKLCIGEPQR